MRQYLDPKIVLIYRPHPVFIRYMKNWETHRNFYLFMRVQYQKTPNNDTL